jgi:hypothetical protein
LISLHTASGESTRDGCRVIESPQKESNLHPLITNQPHYHYAMGAFWTAN